MACERKCIPEFNSVHQDDHRVWGPEEDVKIIELRLLVGLKLARISSMFDNRTAIQLKNRWPRVLKKQDEKGNENEKKRARALSGLLDGHLAK
jgi:hypothetical protein